MRIHINFNGFDFVIPTRIILLVLIKRTLTITMSGQEEGKMQQVDVENYDFNNDAFVKSYGSTTMDDAKARTNRMIDNMKKENENKNRKPSKGFVNEGLEVKTNARLSYFENEKVYPNEWTNSCLNVLEAQLLECQKSAGAHGDAARACRRKHRMLSIPLIIVGTAATALSFLSAGGDVCNTDEEEGNGLKYSVALLTSLATIGTGISALYSFSNKMTENIAASGAFTNLARRIRTQLFLPNHLRSQAEVCLVDFGAEHAHLVNTSPLL